MASSRPVRDRVLILARPVLGRRIEDVLRGAGYEVHRTPDGANLSRLVTQLQPNLVIVALDLPWLDPLDVAYDLAKQPRSVMVLLLGDEPAVVKVDGLLQLPASIEAPALIGEVGRLLGDGPVPPQTSLGPG